MSLRIWGSEAIGLVVIGGIAVAAGIFLVTRDDPEARRVGVLSILLFGAAVPLGIRNGLARWAAVVETGTRPSIAWGAMAALLGTGGLLFEALAMPEHPPWVRIAAGLGASLAVLATLAWVLGFRSARPSPKQTVWIAREGIVEEGDGTVLFPWEHLVGFELIEQFGRPAVRVWLQEHTGTPFLLLDAGQDAAEVAQRAARRRRRLEVTRATTGAPLVLQDGHPGPTVGEVYRTLVRVAREPETVATLPSVLDDPPPIDLGPLPKSPGR